MVSTFQLTRTVKLYLTHQEATEITEKSLAFHSHLCYLDSTELAEVRNLLLTIFRLRVPQAALRTCDSRAPHPPARTRVSAFQAF